MHKSIIYIALIAFLLTSCGKDQDPFTIQKQNIGMLTDSTQVKNLDVVFENDSVVNYIGTNEFTRNINTIDVYDHEGNPLLSLSPSQRGDSTSVFSSVRILDPRFTTDKGITIISTFKDIAEAYEISKIDNLINSIVVSVAEINAAFTIDKKELPANLRFDRNMSIEASQIPDQAKVKYFFIHWN